MVWHWLTMRAIVALDKDDLVLWITQDIHVMLGLLAVAILLRSRTAAVLSGVFFIGLICDQYSYISQTPFEVSAPVGELIGYLAMLIMAGASNGIDRGRRIHRDGCGNLHYPVAVVRNLSRHHLSIRSEYDKKDPAS